MANERVNLNFYRFFRVGNITELRNLRARLRAVCLELDLKGTLLIASEGVNVMVSGTVPSIDAFKAFAQNHLGIEARLFKEAPTSIDSFSRLLVKIKKEIISVGSPDIKPDEKTGKRLAPKTLKRWLDEGKPIILVDTRNRYEVEVGTFKNAQDLNLETSRSFASKAAKSMEEWQNRPVVTFCTGGIRCEKASAHLLNLGLEDVYQLDGGILNYFKEVGADHFEGRCFVFDWRLAVDGNLNPIARTANAEQEFGRHKLKPRR